MRYACLVFDDAADDATLAAAWRAWARQAAGDVLLAARLERRAGRPLSALCVLEAADLNAAIALAGRCPAARTASIEIRPLTDDKESA